MDAFPNWVHHGPQSASHNLVSFTPPRSGQKLRASCDGCYAAKLRCTKERPSCPRCRGLGMVCHYSPSQRTGKTLNRRNRMPTQSLQVSYAYPSPQSTESPGWSLPGGPYDAQSIATTKHQQPITKTGLQTPDSLPFKQSEPNFWDRNASTTTSSVSNEEDFLAQWPDQLSAPTEQDPLYDETSDSLMDINNNATQPTGTHEPMSIINPGGSDPEGCKCFSSIVQALHTMQTQPQNTRRKSLDTILNNSRNLISQGEGMLDCTCSEDGALVMLLAGLIAKHISSFGPPHTNQAAPFASPPPSSSSSSAHASTPRHDNPPSFTPRLTIGTYIMNSEDEERLRIEIVLMELQKLNTLLLRYRRKFSSLPVGGELQTYETMFNFLYARLREAQSRLEEQKQKMRGDA